MSHQVRITARAYADADEAFVWIQERAPQAATRWYASLMAVVETLEDNPIRWELASESEELGIALRQLLFGKRRGVYRVLFTIEGDTVNVLRIRHSAMSLLEPGDI